MTQLILKSIDLFCLGKCQEDINDINWQISIALWQQNREKFNVYE